MKTPRDLYLEIAKQEEDNQLAEILDNPSPTPEELWLLTEKNFIIWRKKYDYPKLLASFDEKLPRFQEWRKYFSIDHELIMEHSVTSFIAPKHKQLKDRAKHLIEAEREELTQYFISDEDVSSKTKDGFGRPAKFQVIKKFVPYSDWRKGNSEYADFFLMPTTWHSPGSDYERIWLDTGYELLKMGGLNVPVNGANVLLRSKALEFVNLSGAVFNGKIYFGENTALTLTYCVADKLLFSDVEMASASFFWSKLTNMKIVNSEIQQWRFVACEVGGDIINSKLRWVNFIDGNVSVVFDNVRLDDVHALSSGKLLRSSYLYRVLKKIYSDQGDDEISGVYYVKEREVARKMLASISFSNWKKMPFWAEKLKYVRMTLAYHYWRYGKSPHRVLICSLFIVLFSALIYFLNPEKLYTVNNTKCFMDCVYFSTMTFTTVGYGDYSPTGILRVVASLEAFLGVANFGFLISGYTASKY